MNRENIVDNIEIDEDFTVIGSELILDEESEISKGYRLGGKFEDDEDFIKWLGNGKPYYFRADGIFEETENQTTDIGFHTVENSGKSYYSILGGRDYFRKAIKEIK